MKERPAPVEKYGAGFFIFENRSLLIMDRTRAGRLILKELYTLKYIVIILMEETPAFFVKDLV